MKIKTVDVVAKEWFDKVNGNSYFSGSVTVNYGMKSAKTLDMPFQYGYGEQYQHEAFQLLQKEKLIPNNPKHGLRLSNWQYYRDNNIIVRNFKHENCLKRELMY